MIALAAVTIIFTAVQKWARGLELENLSLGTLAVLAAGLINAALGGYLIHTGRRTNSLILEANGRHVLTDCWTSLGVVIGLVLVLLTGWKPLDPICALVVALNILWSGGNLVWRSVTGLLDHADPKQGHRLREKLDALCAEFGLQYHGVKFRNSGYRLLVELHLLFPYRMPVGEAHRLATQIEERLPQETGLPMEVITHLEALEDHGAAHREAHYTGKPL
jgi:cation diffusion facilitator family transporter